MSTSLVPLFLLLFFVQDAPHLTFDERSLKLDASQMSDGKKEVKLISASANMFLMDSLFSSVHGKIRFFCIMHF